MNLYPHSKKGLINQSLNSFINVSKLISLVCHNGASPHQVFDPMNLCEAPNLEAQKPLVSATLSTEYHQVSLSNLMFFQITH